MKAGDKWEYLNSGAASETYSLKELTARFCPQCGGGAAGCQDTPCIPRGAFTLAIQAPATQKVCLTVLQRP